MAKIAAIKFNSMPDCSSCKHGNCSKFKSCSSSEFHYLPEVMVCHRDTTYHQLTHTASYNSYYFHSQWLSCNQVAIFNYKSPDQKVIKRAVLGGLQLVINIPSKEPIFPHNHTISPISIFLMGILLTMLFHSCIIQYSI